VFQGRLWGVHYSHHVSGTTAMSLRICILETDVLRPELVDAISGLRQDVRAAVFASADRRRVHVYNVMHGDYPRMKPSMPTWSPAARPTRSAPTRGSRPSRPTCSTRYERGDKLLGVCFGHQLLALTLGGKAERATRAGAWVFIATSSRPMRRG
jgi:hypothetical protein